MEPKLDLSDILQTKPNSVDLSGFAETRKLLEEVKKQIAMEKDDLIKKLDENAKVRNSLEKQSHAMLIVLILVMCFLMMALIVGTWRHVRKVWKNYITKQRAEAQVEMIMSERGGQSSI